MYVTDQPNFVNGACVVCLPLFLHERWSLTTPLFQVQTNLPPVTLLRVLKRIEAHIGRVPSFRNGPRAIDLDIILYDDDIIDTRPPGSRNHLDNLENQLVIPHPRASEREFVLRPLNELVGDSLPFGIVPLMFLF